MFFTRFPSCMWYPAPRTAGRDTLLVFAYRMVKINRIASFLLQNCPPFIILKMNHVHFHSLTSGDEICLYYHGPHLEL